MIAAEKVDAPPTAWGTGSAVVNALTIDVEDYFHVNAFKTVVSRQEWDSYPERVPENTRRILDLLDEYSTRATFFVLGWVAERHPDLVREIARRGHEVACHGYGHELIFDIGPERFKADLRRSRLLLEDLGGAKLKGYRAPSFSITDRSMWALDILLEEGFVYDSSMFPIRHDVYGTPDIDPFPHRIERGAGALWEFPLTTLAARFLGPSQRFPVSGGGYLRLLPAALVLGAFRRINRLDGQPAVLYFHPWEVDPGQPRIAAPLKSRFRHYLNLRRTMGKVGYLLRSLTFAPMAEVLGV